VTNCACEVEEKFFAVIDSDMDILMQTVVMMMIVVVVSVLVKLF